MVADDASWGHLPPTGDLLLDFSGKQVIPASVNLDRASLGRLTSLNLSNTRITEIPEQFRSCTSLTELHLSELHLSEPQVDLAAALSFFAGGLKQLSLAGNQLTEIPREIGFHSFSFFLLFFFKFPDSLFKPLPPGNRSL